MPFSDSSDPRRALPALDRLLAEPRARVLERLYGRAAVRAEARRSLEALRSRLVAPDDAGARGEVDADRLLADVADALEMKFGPPTRRVLNATGVFLHTNLGRAPLPPAVARAAAELATAATDLEFDLAGGRRSERGARVEALLAEATGAPAALVVNNNAAALFLAVATHAAGREIVVSRGELPEIGGSFRIPDILVAAGARLVEVGTTNRTRVADYERAIGPATAFLLKVHPSNYRQTGFVESVEAPALVALGRARGIPVVVDEGAGLLARHRAPALASHPAIAELVAAGCDLVTGSADKLLGGPQGGLLLGRPDLLAPCRRHPLYRALRPGRLVLAALEATLRLRLAGGEAPLERLWPEEAAHHARLARIGAAIGAEIVAAAAYVGGGAAPEEPIPGEALALPADESLLRRLRLGTPPVVGYLHDGRLLLDLRTVDAGDDDALVAAVRAAVAEPQGR